MSITLSMIVKNESHVISKCLNSLKHLINYWIICDTGSTDNTEEICKELLKDIPGEYHHHTWKDFSTNRNIALELSRKHSTHTLFIDADDYLIVNDLNYFRNLLLPAYQINIHHANTVYPRTSIISNLIPVQYKDVIHEYLDYSAPTVLIPDKVCQIIYTGSGARSNDSNKYLNDAKLLEQAILNESNNIRYLFYCAQSYRDAGIYDKAIEYYVARANASGWNEEIYCSFLNIGKILEHLNSDKLEIISAYQRAINVNELRIEAYYYLAKYCRNNNLPDLGYHYAILGSKIPQPNSSLFMEADVYSWKIFDELALNAFYIGRKEEARKITEKLITIAPKQERKRIINNLMMMLD